MSCASATQTLAWAAATISGRASESRKAVARLIGKRRSVCSSGAAFRCTSFSRLSASRVRGAVGAGAGRAGGKFLTSGSCRGPTVGAAVSPVKGRGWSEGWARAKKCGKSVESAGDASGIGARDWALQDRAPIQGSIRPRRMIVDLLDRSIAGSSLVPRVWPSLFGVSTPPEGELPAHTQTARTAGHYRPMALRLLRTIAAITSPPVDLLAGEH